MSEAEQKGVKEINKDALKRMSYLFENIEQNKNKDRVNVNISFHNYEDLGSCLTGIFDIIQEVCINGTIETQNGNISHLCEIAKQIIPHNEFEFIDHLLFKEAYQEKSEFVKIDSL
jgi:hypothetical protein